LKGGSMGGAGDLARDVAEGRMTDDGLGGLPATDLPAEMSGLDKDGRRRYVAQKNEERNKIQAEINDIAAKRNDFLKGKKKADAFDTGVENTIKAQAKSIGVAW
jgi:hypothetical protein